MIFLLSLRNNIEIRGIYKMKATKVLFIAQEITPYLPESEIANVCRYLPQGVQERGREIRTFMPKYGNINERRNQLHEVIRHRPSLDHKGRIYSGSPHASIFYR